MISDSDEPGSSTGQEGLKSTSGARKRSTSPVHRAGILINNIMLE